jgi:hypothetical protein
MAAGKSEFRQLILIRLLPYLESQGFKKWKPGGRNDVPAVYLERYRQGRRDLLEIQFDKYGRLAFFVNLATVTGDSVETMFEGVLPASQVTTSHLREQCRLTGRGFSQAFKPTLFSRLSGVAKAAETVAAMFMSLFAEAHEWFVGGAVGPHIYTYRL